MVLRILAATDPLREWVERLRRRTVDPRALL